MLTNLPRDCGGWFLGLIAFGLPIPRYRKRSFLPENIIKSIRRSRKLRLKLLPILVSARWLSAYASYEHEKISEEQSHLDPDKVQRLIAGLPVSFDDPRQDVVYEVAYALVEPRPVSLGLYRKAKDKIGDAGLVDVAVLIGWFTMVSMTLAAFDVPANADSTGLKQ